MSQLSKESRALLELIEEHGSLSLPDMLGLDRIDAVLADASMSLRGRVGQLVGAGHLLGDKPRTNQPTQYSVTGAGLRALRSSGTFGGSIATARAPYLDPSEPDGRYDGSDLRPFTARAGAMDAFKLPSVEAGQRVARRVPQLLPGGMEPKA